MRPASRNRLRTNSTFSASFFKGSQAIISGFTFLIASRSALPLTPPLCRNTTVVDASTSPKYRINSSLLSSGKSCKSRIMRPRRSEKRDGESASAISPTIVSAAKRFVISAFSLLSSAIILARARSARAASEPRTR